MSLTAKLNNGRIFEGSLDDPRSLCSFLQWCSHTSNLSSGMEIHHLILHNGCISDVFLPNYLIRLYTKFGCLYEAHHVFSSILYPNVFSWSAIISGYAKHGHHEKAIKLYHRMRKSNVEPDGHAYVAALTACTNGLLLEHGKMIHSHILSSTYKVDLYVNNTVVDMYVKCGSIDSARDAFIALPMRDLVTWNSLLAGFVQHKMWQEAISHFEEMQSQGIMSNHISLSCVLKAYSHIGDVCGGMICYAYAIEHGFQIDSYVGNSLVDMYAKFESIPDAERVFAMLPMREIITWSALIAGYIHCGHFEEAMQRYEMMQGNGVEPNHITFVSILKACTRSIEALDIGRLIHGDIMLKEHMTATVVDNALIEMDRKGASFDDALRLFKGSFKEDVVIWNMAIKGCVLNVQSHMAFDMFNQLLQEGVNPCNLTFLNIISACTADLDLYLVWGRIIHLHIIECGFHHTSCVSNSLINMYIKCKRIEAARKLFDEMTKHDLVTWNTMIGGYSECGSADEALGLFYLMQYFGVPANPVTLVCILKACSGIVALANGRMIHAYISERNLKLDSYVGSALINFYARCGSLDDAQRVFVALSDRSVVLWSAMIAAFAQRNKHKEALGCFDEMKKGGVEPDDIAYISLLSSFSHSGMLYEGENQFKQMVDEHVVEPSLKHYNCMVDLLGRGGYLDQAEKMLRSMPHSPDLASWTSMFSHCRTHSNMALAGSCFVKSSNFV